MGLPKEVELGRKFEVLFRRPEWKVFAEFCEELRRKWSGNLVKFSLGSSVEHIAVERIRFTSMIEGVEQVFIQMNGMMEEAREYEKKTEKQKNNLEEDVPLKARDVNPYRLGGEDA